MIVIRWFDHGVYKGETVFRIDNANQRESGKRSNGDMQLIELDASNINAFSDLVHSKDITNIQTFIKKPDGTFKGKYFKTPTSKLYQNQLQSLKNDDQDRTHSYRFDPFIRKETVMYEYDSKQIVDSKTLQSVKNQLADDPDKMIDITAYASQENSTNDPDYNKKLSQGRADAIKDYLVKNGVDKKE